MIKIFIDTKVKAPKRLIKKSKYWTKKRKYKLVFSLVLGLLIIIIPIIILLIGLIILEL